MQTTAEIIEEIKRLMQEAVDEPGYKLADNIRYNVLLSLLTWIENK